MDYCTCFSVSYIEKNKNTHYLNEYVCDTLKESAEKILEWHEIYPINEKLYIEGKELSEYDNFKNLPDTYDELIDHIMQNHGIYNDKYNMIIVEHGVGC